MRTDLLQQRLHAGPCWFTDRPSGGANTGDSTRAAVCLGRRPTAASSTRHGACWRPHTPAGLQLTDQQPCARHGCCSHKGVCATHTRPGAPNGLSEDSIRIHVSTLPRFPRARATSGSHGGLRVCAPGCCAHPGPAPELGHSTWCFAPCVALLALRACRRLAEEVRRCALAPAAVGQLGAVVRACRLTPGPPPAQPAELLPATLRRCDSCCRTSYGSCCRKRHGAGPGRYAACAGCCGLRVCSPASG